MFSILSPNQSYWPLNQGALIKERCLCYQVSKNKLDEKNDPTIVVHAYNPSTQEVEAGGSQVQGQLGLHQEFKASQGYIAKVSLKRTKTTKQTPHSTCFHLLPS
jgi:hypothetical protein